MSKILMFLYLSANLLFAFSSNYLPNIKIKTSCDKVLHKSAFDICYSCEWKTPKMVIYKVDGNLIDSKNLSRKHLRFRPDYQLSAKCRSYPKNYSKTGYAANFIYVATTPNAKTVEFAAYLTGLFPTKDPFDIYGGDITAIDKLDYEQEFSVDYIWVNDEWVKKKAETLISSLSSSIENLTGTPPKIGV